MRFARWIWLISISLVMLGCVDNPLDQIKKDLASYDEYSVVLKDMQETDNFPGQFHKYSVVAIKKPPQYSEAMQDAVGQEKEPKITKYDTEWMGVPEDLYQKHINDLGMTILSRDANGNIRDTAQPAGYQYVGNPSYGRWVNNSSGGSFWEFYGKYRLMSDAFDLFRHRAYRNDWDHYNDSYRGRNRPYYGRQNQYGTNGSVAKKTNPTFFERRQAKQAAREKSFSNRFKNRVNRSRSGYRSRSSGFGK
ncbi:hypothetical protein [Pseudobacteriovorax antillogorgiicola]|uniref:Lipoprotein n=1 Tax=Pseudobacteriovorax antillogorgiicola TaxID=1513793 RepID=A0A1Y6CRK7_9BACT|nr:hypothetical protein [Pseudobacteriovorax antillogorgiicola]TCS41261.1 hypothetical protein EDD56_1495 [Pseudobacteriovorax antillogorgiicola]SMF83748.1 hypothetical protein SAMN06296036_1495 [Pseudobacteriovorax antillogorgiicola]